MKTVCSLLLLFSLSLLTASPAEEEPSDEGHHMSEETIESLGGFQSGDIAILIYPGFTALDAFGPHHMFINLMGEKTHFVAATKDPVKTDTGAEILPDLSFEDCPEELLVLCIPGGTSGTVAAMKDEATLAFVRSRGEKAKYVTSVCTGSLILGAAGLLDGYEATSHWAATDLLPGFGAKVVDKRVVEDRNRITGAGVTAGMDLGLLIVAKLRGEDYAKGVQLLSEYDPEPPFDAGSIEKSDPAMVGMLEGMFSGFREKVKKLAVEYQKR